jgi:Mechanosensitive ion channel, conserved TM helix
MEVAMQQQWSDIVLDAMRDVGHRILIVTPRLLAALTLILLGWAVAAVVRRVTIRVLAAADLDVRCARWGLTGVLGRGGHRPSPTELLGRLVYWAIFLLGLLMAVEALEMPGTRGAVGVLLAFLPHVLIAVLVVVGGWMLAHFLAQAVLIAAVNAQVAGASLLAAAVRWLVLTVAAAVALTELGVAREMVLLVFGIAFGGAVLALSLAFGLGARELARQALESYLSRAREDRGEPVSHV